MAAVVRRLRGPTTDYIGYRRSKGLRFSLLNCQFLLLFLMFALEHTAIQFGRTDLHRPSNLPTTVIETLAASSGSPLVVQFKRLSPPEVLIFRRKLPHTAGTKRQILTTSVALAALAALADLGCML